MYTPLSAKNTRFFAFFVFRNMLKFCMNNCSNHMFNGLQHSKLMKWTIFKHKNWVSKRFKAKFWPNNESKNGMAVKYVEKRAQNTAYFISGRNTSNTSSFYWSGAEQIYFYALLNFVRNTSEILSEIRAQPCRACICNFIFNFVKNQLLPRSKIIKIN